MSETVLVVGGGGREHALARAIASGIKDRPDADDYRFVACASNRNPGIAELVDAIEEAERRVEEAFAQTDPSGLRVRHDIAKPQLLQDRLERMDAVRSETREWRQMRYAARKRSVNARFAGQPGDH